MKLSLTENQYSIILSFNILNLSNDSSSESFDIKSNLVTKNYGNLNTKMTSIPKRNFFNIKRKSEIEENFFTDKRRRKQEEPNTWTNKEKAFLFSFREKKMENKWDLIGNLIKTKTSAQCYYHFDSCNSNIK